jgi:hypothetical protein
MEPVASQPVVGEGGVCLWGLLLCALRLPPLLEGVLIPRLVQPVGGMRVTV